MPKLDSTYIRKSNPVAMKASEFGKVRSELAKRGYTAAQINAALGASVGGRDRDAVIVALKALLNSAEARAKRAERARTPVKEKPQPVREVRQK